jgi:hypothetical protein
LTIFCMFPCLATLWKSETCHTKVIIIFDVYLTAGKRSTLCYITDQLVFHRYIVMIQLKDRNLHIEPS